MTDKVGRNDPCPCGSGKKFKKCCLARIRPTTPDSDSQQPGDMPIPEGRPSVEPHLDLIPSIVWKEQNCRVRLLWNRLHRCPMTQTFHEFLIDLVKWTFGRQWWMQQVSMRDEDRHAVVRWAYAWAEVTKAVATTGRSEGGEKSMLAPGPVWSLVQLGYDFYCLQGRNKLPEPLLGRLRRHRTFQGARYEITAASVMIRSGFEIEFLEEGSASGATASSSLLTSSQG